MHKLIIEDDEGKAVVVPLIRDEITVGRQEGNTIRLTERNVSRRHARLTRRDGVYFVEDLTSFTGTKVNGVPISGAVPLSDGDRIHIADYKLGIKVERAALATAMGFSPAAATAASADSTVTPPLTAAMAAPVPGGAPAPMHAMAVAPVGAGAVLLHEPIEGAPTMPVRTLLEERMGAGGPAPGALGRLVVVGGPLKGEEILIDRSSIVIGRTGESDVVLNHKSISRQHAKIIREGDRHVVVDLQSANGVRVNGVEYERVELQPGDVVELGHVRLRFIVGEDGGGFDAESFGLGGSSRKPLVIGVGIGLVVVAIVAVIVVVSGDKKPTAAVATVPSPAPPPVSQPAVQESGTAFLARANEAFKQEKWQEALDLTTKAAATTPGLAGADELRKSIEAERLNEGQFQSVRQAAEGTRHDEVLTAFAAIPEGSVYKEKARPLYQESRGKLLTQRLAIAEKHRAAGDCDELDRDLEAIRSIDPDNANASEMKARCARAAARAAAATKPAPAPKKEQPAVTKAVAAAAPVAKPVAARAPKEEREPAAAGDPDELLNQAQQAWLNQQFAAAIESSRKALRIKPGLTRAHQIIAVCSCSLRDATSASRSYEKLDDQMKKMVRQICQSKGVTLE